MQVGKNDDKPDITSTAVWIGIDVPMQIRYVQFHFGGHSADHGGSGSALYRLHVQQVAPPPNTHPWPEPLVSIDYDDGFVFGGSSKVKGTVKGHPKIVAGPSGELDAFEFTGNSMILLGPKGVDTDKTWTIDTWIKTPLKTTKGGWRTLTRGYACISRLRCCRCCINSIVAPLFLQPRW